MQTEIWDEAGKINDINNLLQLGFKYTKSVLHLPHFFTHQGNVLDIPPPHK
jgi:hypothetical protein